MRDILKTLRSETESTIRHFYAFQQFKYLLGDVGDVDLINRNGAFWRLFASSQLQSVFIGIRRIFETYPDTFNFAGAVRAVKSRIGEFQPEALEQRKLEENNGQRPGWLDNYIAEAYIATIDDVDALARLVRPHRSTMESYTYVADKIFAHAIITVDAEISEALAELQLEDIEASLNSVWHFYEQVWQMYENGRKPSLTTSTYPHIEEVQQSVIRQVRGTS